MNSHNALIGCWVGFTVLFFSFSQSKLPGYILPAIPPLFVLLGYAVARPLGQGGKDTVWQMGATGILFLVFAVSLVKPALNATRLYEIANVHGIITVLTLDVVGGLGILTVSLLKRPKTALFGVVLLVTILVELSNIGILPQVDRIYSPREVARLIISGNSSVPDVAEYKLSRSWGYGLNYYFGRELRQWVPGSPQPDWIVTTPRAAQEVQQDGIQVQGINTIGKPAVILLHVLRAEEKGSVR